MKTTLKSSNCFLRRAFPQSYDLISAYSLNEAINFIEISKDENIEGLMSSILKTNIAYDALHSVSNSDTY